MPYYTDEDRESAAAARKRNRMLKQLAESPEDAYDILGVSVPKVFKEPEPSAFGLSENIQQKLIQLDGQSVAKKKTRNNSILLLLAAIDFLIGLWFFLSTEDFGRTFALSGIGGGFILLLAWGGLSDPKPD